ncbi:uncharacterized protein BKA78DRAFT_325606 [Phyllosticta capitalensis]|uniref:uncharacterized protein n=1 Tax=Phyllosticta capitalensis TaxID=121624 RepID=UPI003131C632
MRRRTHVYARRGGVPLAARLFLGSWGHVWGVVVGPTTGNQPTSLYRQSKARRSRPHPPIHPSHSLITRLFLYAAAAAAAATDVPTAQPPTATQHITTQPHPPTYLLKRACAYLLHNSPK